MFDSARSVRRRRLTLALGTSTLAWSIALPMAAQAQCAPDPTVANGTTTCTGTDADGLRVTTPNTVVTVADGATVGSAAAPAIAVDIPPGSSIYGATTINVLGSVSGAGQDGISVTAGAPDPIYYNTARQVTLNVGSGGSVSGTTALSLRRGADDGSGTVSAFVDNAGTLTGTSGIALLGNATRSATDPSPLTTFYSITNEATGRIVGGIVGSIYTLANAGSIDGGTASAVDAGGAASGPVITNASGATIRSAAASATIATGSSYYLTVTNAGTIANSGGGAALSAGTVALTNQAGGVVTGGISAASSLNLVNRGMMTGDVLAGGGGNMIDSSAGTINGSVTLGSGNNLLIARYDGSPTLATGITGAINVGGGTNTERVVFATDTSVTTRIDPTAGFQTFVLAPDAGATATLETGFSTSTPVVLAGGGAVINRATIDVAGPAITDLDYRFGSSASFRNEGAISATVSGGPYQEGGLVLDGYSFTNIGSVTVNGGAGVVMSYNPVDNRGTITASGIGVNIFDGVLTNSGAIVSTQGVGVSLFGDVGYTASNSGTIQGATIGATTSGYYLTNTGTIGSSGTGVVVQGYGYLVNAAGGIVNGGTGGAVTVGAFNAGVANAGTINGDVTFNGFGSGNNLAYIALTGGMLNGNLKLGDGATLVTDLANPGPGQFAGISGTVTAGSNTELRYAVNADASAVLPAGNLGPFGTVGYQLANGAALTLTAPRDQTRTQTLLLAGTGSVDLDANIAVAGAAAIRSTDSITYPGGPNAATSLAIISRGALAISRTTNDPDYYNAAGAVILSSADTFTNAGDITVTDHAGYRTAGIYGGATVTNSGRIMVDGGGGIVGTFRTVNLEDGSLVGAARIVNTGTISQVAGGSAGFGVAFDNGTFDNLGTIDVGGTAVQLGFPYGSSAITLNNSGTLRSTAGIAITNDEFYRTQLTINNLAGGTISGGGGTAIRLSGTMLSNAGAITGTVDLGSMAGYASNEPVRSRSSSTYIAAGGTISGDLLFGDGDDLLLQTGTTLGVSGVVDGGGGTDIYGRSLASSGTVALDRGPTNFEDALVQAVGTGTVVTVTGAGTFGGNLYATGTGSVINQATIAGTLAASAPPAIAASGTNALFPGDQMLASLTNTGSVAGGVSGSTASFTNSGTISQSGPYGSAVALEGGATLAFANSGTIDQTTNVPSRYFFPSPTASLSATTSVTIDNSGKITGGGLFANAIGDNAAASIDVTNSGAITSINGAPAAELEIGSYYDAVGKDGTVRVTNSGTISAQLDATNDKGPFGIQLDALALFVGGASRSTTITNAATGTITASGRYAAAVATPGSSLDLTNAGTISATGIEESDAVVTVGAFADRVTNRGTINGNIDLDAGDDTVDNAGTINGAVLLGDGDDRFIQRAGGTMTGLVDGGAGTNSYVVDATGGTATLAGSQISGFQSVVQTGTGSGIYSGRFDVATIGLQGGTLSVAAGQTLATTGTTTITGGDSGVSVANAGTIAGGITLGGGADSVVNNGTIGGPVQLGAGNDSYTDGAGSVAAGGVSGGDGVDLYRVALAGDRAGIGARTNFEQLAVTGAGTLSLTLDQDFQSVALDGASLNLSLASHSVGSVTGSDAAETFAVSGDVASVALGGGDDMLVLGTSRAAGAYDGGAGNNALRFTTAAPVTLAGTAVNFRTVALAGNALVVAGTLGSAGATISFGGDAQQLTVANGGTIAGSIDLGDGDDGFRLAAGGTIAGTVAGGAGNDVATIELGGSRTLAGGSLTGFETLATEGSGQLTIGGPLAFDTVTTNGDLTIATGGSLTAAQVRFGSGDNRFSIAGQFTGSVDGGSGTDVLTLAGGSAAAPIALQTVTGFESLAVSGGVATIADNAAFGRIDMTGGRLIGLAGSTITAPHVNVGAGATFGSAGTVVGNLAVGGTLSPGASPGTMRVTGNVSFASGSTSLFELTPAVSDQLLVSGTLSIAGGATLTLTGNRPLTPGAALDLIVANGGITGSFTTINQPATILGFLRQSSDRLQLFGQFAATGFSPQVTTTINYVNGILTSGQASAGLIAAVPLLLTSGNGTNGAAFARLNPEAYASATQISVENGLSLAKAARSGIAAPAGEQARLFSFVQGLGNWRPLDGSGAQGISRARTNSHGVLGGLGFGSAAASLGGFVGYLDSHQHIADLGARTHSNGVVAGLLGHAATAGFDVTALLGYDGGKAVTRRNLPGSLAAIGHYRLRGWVGDASIGYALPLGADWSLKPAAGATYVSTRRGGAAETGGGAFSLDVSGRRSHATFVDGSLTLQGGATGGARVQPWVSAGVRHQLNGQATLATARFEGVGAGFSVSGVARSRTLATAGAGLSFAVTPGLDLFASYRGEFGKDGTGTNLNGGLRMRF